MKLSTEWLEDKLKKITPKLETKHKRVSLRVPTHHRVTSLYDGLMDPCILVTRPLCGPSRNE